MATLSFSFDTGSVPAARIVDAVAVVYGYSANIDDPQNPGQTIPNPQTKAQFAKQVVKQILIAAVRETDLRAARAAADAGVTQIDLT